MANVIRAGGTLYQAVQTVVQQAPEPMRAEFVRVERAMQLQMPPGDALALIQDRLGLHEFTSVVIACKVAGEAGADLDVVLESIARELVEERQFLRAMETASAEGKASARMVTAVPLAVMAFVNYRNPDYFGDALRDPTGRMVILGSLGAIALGWLLIRRITDVRNW
nr:type II secretion system F family protein [Symbiobacterium terraclitae]